MLKKIIFVMILCCKMLSAEEKYLHLNPVIAKLTEKEIVYGLMTSDLSLFHAREMARAPVDFVYVDMEHNPLDFSALNMFMIR